MEGDEIVAVFARQTIALLSPCAPALARHGAGPGPSDGHSGSGTNIHTQLAGPHQLLASFVLRGSFLKATAALLL